jgi:hypothetical protein
MAVLEERRTGEALDIWFLLGGRCRLEPALRQPKRLIDGGYAPRVFHSNWYEGTELSLVCYTPKQYNCRAR